MEKDTLFSPLLTSISMGSTSIFFHSSSNCAIGIFENFPSDQVSRVRKKVTRGPKQHRDGQTGRQSPRQRPALLAGRGLLRVKSGWGDRGRRRGPGVPGVRRGPWGFNTAARLARPPPPPAAPGAAPGPAAASRSLGLGGGRRRQSGSFRLRAATLAE